MMSKLGAVKDNRFEANDYVSMHPYEETNSLIEKNLIKEASTSIKL